MIHSQQKRTTSVKFFDWNPAKMILRKDEVNDIVDTLVRFDGEIIFHGSGLEKKPGLLGMHHYNVLFGGHDIYLDPDRIREHVESKRRAGGNRVVPDVRLGVAMVLAHELQHANQHHKHKSEHSSFFGKHRSRYKTRPCEREARQFADDSIPVLAGILDIRLAKESTIQVPPDELREVAELLMEGDMVSVQDIVEELRLSGLNNATNVGAVRTLLEIWGMTIQ